MNNEKILLFLAWLIWSIGFILIVFILNKIK
jgi:hypothetical protein